MSSLRSLACVSVLVALFSTFVVTSVADGTVTFEAKKIFPLKPNTRWEYDAQRIFGESKNGLAYRLHCEKGAKYQGKETFVIVTRFASGRRRKEILQREYYYFDDAGQLLCHRRDNGPVVVRFSPPQLVLKARMKAGDKWTWEGKFGAQDAIMSSTVRGAETIKWKDKDVTCLKVYSVTKPKKSAYNNIQKRTLWFAPGVGMIREDSIDKTDRAEVRIIGNLHNFYPGK